MVNTLLGFFVTHLTLFLLAILLIGFMPRMYKNFKSAKNTEIEKTSWRTPLFSFGVVSLAIEVIAVIFVFVLSQGRNAPIYADSPFHNYPISKIFLGMFLLSILFAVVSDLKKEKGIIGRIAFGIAVIVLIFLIGAYMVGPINFS